MFSYIPISYLNDFSFCPRSIYYHTLYQDYDSGLYQHTPQVAGRAAHRSVDSGRYSTRRDVIQGLDVYSARFNLCGRIDIYVSDTKTLRERKNKIKRLYDGYVFQLYAQYFCMIEMGFEVEKLSLYFMDDNKSYKVALPERDMPMYRSFCDLIESIQNYRLMETPFTPNPAKCAGCIYRELCDAAPP